MIDTEYVKYPPTSIDDIKDEKLEAYLKSIYLLLLMKLKIEILVNLKNPSENLVTMKIIN